MIPLKDLKTLLQILEESSICEFEYQDESGRVRLVFGRGASREPAVSVTPAPVSARPASATARMATGQRLGAMTRSLWHRPDLKGLGRARWTQGMRFH